MEVRELNSQRFQEFLIDHIGVPIDLTLTNNRRSMIMFRWSHNRLTLRIHQMFLHADHAVWRALASFCRSPSLKNRRVLDEYIAGHKGFYSRTVKRSQMLVLETKGERYDLDELFARLNRKHFKRQCDARITWGRDQQSRKKRNGIQLGSYDPELNLIRINRALDHAWVPRYVVENMLYHEMLHWLFRPRQAGPRRVVHGKAFREAEQAHPNYARTKEWVAQNLDRLLRS